MVDVTAIKNEDEDQTEQKSPDCVEEAIRKDEWPHEQ